jgi:uncharacterized membrane protein
MGSYTEAADFFMKGLRELSIDIDYIPGHKATTDFPMTLEEMNRYQVIIISDVGSNTLLLHPSVQNQCKRIPNRLKVLKEYVAQGGGLLMCGGYMGFSGFMGKARYGVTPIADALPVEIMNYDDRIEEPGGVFPNVLIPDHPILDGIEGPWPDFLGYNCLKAGQEGTLIATVNDSDAFIAVREFKNGRTGIFASDIAPHWAPPEFLNWKYYGKFFANYLMWLAHVK